MLKNVAYYAQYYTHKRCNIMPQFTYNFILMTGYINIGTKTIMVQFYLLATYYAMLQYSHLWLIMLNTILKRKLVFHSVPSWHDYTDHFVVILY